MILPKLKRQLCVFNNIEVKSNQPVAKYWNRLHFRGKGKKENQESGWNSWRSDVVDFFESKDTSNRCSKQIWIKVCRTFSSALDLPCAKYLPGVWRSYSLRNLFNLGVRRTCINFCWQMSPWLNSSMVFVMRKACKRRFFNWALINRHLRRSEIYKNLSWEFVH